MKILLCGDYSSVHSELAVGLKKAGQDVTVLSDGDYYKNFPADIKISIDIKKRNIFEKALYLILDLFGLYGLIKYKKTIKTINLENYDIVQLINPVVISQFGAIGNLLFINHLSKKTNNIFLCALGDDTRWVKACLSKTYKYSPLDSLKLKNFIKFYYSLKYVYIPGYYFLGKFAEYKSKAIITGLIDYEIAYNKYNIKTKLIRLPISKDKFNEPPKKSITDKITIFHAWQKGKESKKGNDVLDLAVKIIIKKYGFEKINYETASGLTYDKFIKKYNNADIFLDQIYSYDRGVSGALGMCSGKVVFSGFEDEEVFSLNAPLNIKKTGVNATKNLDSLVEALSYLIENNNILEEIKTNAYLYAIENYDSDLISKQYLDYWNENII